MKTLCGIWSWEHCLLYSLARDLQGRFTEAWHTLRLSQRPLLLPLASAVCPLAILPSPSQLCVCVCGGGLTTFPLSTGRQDFPPALFISSDEKEWLPACQSKQSLHSHGGSTPPCPTLRPDHSHTQPPGTLQRGCPEYLNQAQDSEGRAVSLPHVTTIGCRCCHQRLELRLSKMCLSPPWTISPAFRDRKPKCQHPRVAQ